MTLSTNCWKHSKNKPGAEEGKTSDNETQNRRNLPIDSYKKQAGRLLPYREQPTGHLYRHTFGSVWSSEDSSFKSLLSPFRTFWAP